MTTHRSPIIRLRTTGSRHTGDLRADIPWLPAGLNWIVIGYATDDSYVDGYLAWSDNEKVVNIKVNNPLAWKVLEQLPFVLEIGVSGVSYPTRGIKFVAPDGTEESA